MLKKLTQRSLFSVLQKCAQALPDPRSRAPNLHYSLGDLVMLPFMAFFTQQESFREFELSMHQRSTWTSLRRLLHLESKHPPVIQTVRNALDQVSEGGLRGAFDGVFSRMERSGLLSKLRASEEIGILISLDGTRHIQSDCISCSACGITQTKDGIRHYHHNVVHAGITHPSQAFLFPLYPEFIRPQDGHQKQDCEQVAGKRWLSEFRRRHPKARATLLVDNIYCREPFLQAVLSHRLNFIAVCKPSGNPTAWNWFETASSGGDTKVIVKHRIDKGRVKTFHYEYLNDVPIRDGANVLHVNVCSMRIEQAGKADQLFCYATNLPLNESNCGSVIAAGRKRWSTENENNNTLKNQGYHLTHNFGHGSQHLFFVLTLLNLFAFLTHSLLKFVNQERLASILHTAHARMVCFSALRMCLNLEVHATWESLYVMTLKALGLT